MADSDPIAIQRRYYQDTAASYDTSHVHEDDEHYEALAHIEGFIRTLGIRSLLDSGCGTGRGVKFLVEHFPTMEVKGNDPSQELLDIAYNSNRIPRDQLICSDTVSLPFSEGRFDAVTSFGVLHHVPNPTQLIARMLSLAKKAVFISDSNYLAQGRAGVRLVKYALTKAGVWKSVKFVQQGFRSWAYSEGDGVYYSYSVFNDLPLIEQHCRSVVVLPVGPRPLGAAACPLLLAPTALVCGIK